MSFYSQTKLRRGRCYSQALQSVASVSHLVSALTLAVILLAHVAVAQDESGTQSENKARSDATSNVASDAASPSKSAGAEDRLRSTLKTVVEKHSIPAMWAGKYYVANGHITPASYQACYGIRKFGEDALVSLGDRIHLGSCTKAMTAVLLAELIAEEKLSWTTTLGDLFSEVTDLPSSPWATVSVRELLEHRSGAPANAAWFDLERKHEDVIEGRAALLKWLIDRPRPDSKEYLYSNVGYALLGHIAEKLEGESWESLVQKRVHTPLGIQTAGFGPVLSSSEIDEDPLSGPWGHTAPPQSAMGVIGRAVGNMFGAESPTWKPVQFDNAIPLGPAGRCHMSLQDWAKFVALFAGAAEKSGQTGLALPSSAWKDLTRPQLEDSDYAGGWIVTERSWGGGTVYNHAGTNTSWFCVAWVAPKKNFFILVAVNAYSEQISGICDGVVARLVQDPQ